MKPQTAWQTHCPECKQKIRLAVKVTEGPKIPGKKAIEATVKVDTSEMRKHMQDKHPERYQGTNPNENRSTT